MKEFTTENLIVRPYRPSDYSAWKEGVESRLPSQNEFDTGRIENADKVFFYDFLSHLGKLMWQDKCYVYAAFEKTNLKQVGVLELSILVRDAIDWGLFGISINNQFWGKGYGKELTALAPEIAKQLSIRRLECMIETNNLRSKKMISSFGYRFEGTKKEFYFNGGKYVDVDVFTKII